MTTFLIALTAWVVVSFPIGALLGRAMRDLSAPCTCRKHAWDPRCPVHGTEASHG
jgi:hypothetical protein